MQSFTKMMKDGIITQPVQMILEDNGWNILYIKKIWIVYSLV